MPSQVPRVNEPPAVEVVGGQGETVGASDLDDRGEGAPAAEGDGGAAGDGARRRRGAGGAWQGAAPPPRPPPPAHGPAGTAALARAGPSERVRADAVAEALCYSARLDADRGDDPGVDDGDRRRERAPPPPVESVAESSSIIQWPLEERRAESTGGRWRRRPRSCLRSIFVRAGAEAAKGRAVAAGRGSPQ
jgi:hypothetical protein